MLRWRSERWHVVRPHVWQRPEKIKCCYQQQKKSVLQLVIRLWECKKKGYFLVWGTGTELLSGFEALIWNCVPDVFTSQLFVTPKEAAAAFVPSEGCTSELVLCCRKGGETAGQHNKRKTNHHSSDGFSRTRLDNTGWRNAERWYQPSLIASVTFTADLSTICHLVQLCHLSVTFFSILVCWAIYATVKHHRPSSLRRPLCGSVQLVGSIRRRRARLTEVTAWHIAGQIKGARCVAWYILFSFYPSECIFGRGLEKHSTLWVFFIITCQSDDKGCLP